MVLRFKIKLAGLAEIAQRLVVLFSAALEVGIGHVGKPEHEGGQLRFDLFQLFVVGFGLCTELFHLGKDGSGVFSLFFILRDELVGTVLLRLERLVLGDDRTALFIELNDHFNVLAGVSSLFGEAGDDLFGLFFDELDI